MTKTNIAKRSGKKPGVPARRPRHGLYCDPKKVKVDGRSFFGKLKKKIRGHLLEVFKGNANPLAQTLADGTAANLVIAKAFQAAFLRGEVLPTTIMRDYTGLWNAISRDLQALSQMAKDGTPPEKVPSLKEYLDLIAANKLIPVESEKEAGACKCQEAKE